MVSISPQLAEQKLRAFANMPDRQIRQLAKIEAAHDYKDSKSRKFGNFAFKSVPVVDVLAASVLAGTTFSKTKEGKVVIEKTAKTLSQKLGAGMKRAGFWGGAIALVSLLGAINNKIESKSPKYAKYRDHHKGLNFFTDLAIFLGAFVGASKGAQALSKTVKPTKVAQWISKITKKATSLIDKSIVAKFNTEKVTPFIKKVAEKFPKFKKVAPLALANAAFIAIGVGFLSKMVAGAKYNHHQKETYATIKNAQLATAQTLLNKTEKQ